MRGINLLPYCLYPFCFVLVIAGCASVSRQESEVLAWVDGEPVTIEDLGYSLQIAHRREDLSTTRQYDISQYIQKLIDDRLIVQEARRMNLEDAPAIKEKVREFVLRESVVKLYNEEIVGKVTVSSKDITDYYRENYDVLTLEVIEAADAGEAEDARSKLLDGRRIEDRTAEHADQGEKENTEEVVVKRKALRPSVRDAVEGLKPGEVSNVIKIHDTYQIIKLLDRQAAPDEELESVRADIERILKEQEIKKRSDEYLVDLRKKYDVKIDRELLASVMQEGEGTREEWLHDSRPLIAGDSLTLTAGEFAAMLQEKPGKSKEENLNTWIDFKLVDLEALGRHYDLTTDLKDKVQRYKNVLLNAAFIREAVKPAITITEKDAEDYYMRHQEDYVKPVKYRIQQITVGSEEEAQDILNSLAGGANFAWLAKAKSGDSLAADGGVTEWKINVQLPEPVREVIDNMKPGDTGPVLKIDGVYMVFRLMDKSAKEIEEYSNVRTVVFNAAYKEKFQEIRDVYIDKLRKDAKIEINDEAVRAYEETFYK